MKQLLLFLPLVFLIISCNGVKATIYYPLTVGNEWNYEWTTTITSPDTTFTDIMATIMNEITAETTLDNGIEVFEGVQTAIFTIDTSTIVDTFYFGETDRYILRYESKSDTAEPDTFLTLPLEELNIWTLSEDCIATVVGEEDVTVPADSYTDCWKIAYIGAGDTSIYYFASNIGVVKVEWTETYNSTVADHIEELTSATIR